MENQVFQKYPKKRPGIWSRAIDFQKAAYGGRNMYGLCTGAKQGEWCKAVFGTDVPGVSNYGPEIKMVGQTQNHGKGYGIPIFISVSSGRLQVRQNLETKVGFHHAVHTPVGFESLKSVGAP